MDDVLNFRDLFRESVLKLEAFRGISYLDIAIGMLLSFVVGMFIYFIYKKTFRGVLYSHQYNVTFVLMAMITSMVIMTVGSNIILSLGMVGALSIVRFRTAVKDPLDIVYMFWAISAGIAIGAKLYPLALAGSAVIGLTAVVLSRRKPRGLPYLLVVRYDEQASETVMRHLRQLRGYRLKSKTVRKSYTELTAEIRLRDDNTAFMNALSAAEGVHDVSLLQYTGEYAQ